MGFAYNWGVKPGFKLSRIKGLKMNSKKVFLWSAMALVIMIIVISHINTQEYYQFEDSFGSLPPNRTIVLSQGVEMRRGAKFQLILNEKGLSRPYSVFFNTCTRIPYEMISPHHDAVAQTDVIVCNILGKMYYRIPIT
jgi:hypothetical protein